MRRSASGLGDEERRQNAAQMALRLAAMLGIEMDGSEDEEEEEGEEGEA